MSRASSRKWLSHTVHETRRWLGVSDHFRRQVEERRTKPRKREEIFFLNKQVTPSTSQNGNARRKELGIPRKPKKKQEKLDRATGMQDGGQEMEGGGSVGKGRMAGGTGRLGFLF